MSSVSSPVHRYSSDFDNLMYDQNFTADINNKMRVPRKILVTGESNNSDEMTARVPPSDAEIRDTVNMCVPDRIIVAGHEQHEEAKAPPRELHLEQVLAPKPSVIRVETPPRVLTLEDHYFPTVDEDQCNETPDHKSHHKKANNPSEPMDDTIRVVSELPAALPSHSFSDDMLSPSEEILTLKRQLIKLNRRVMCLEHDSQLHQQREVIVYSFGVAYFVLKALLWLHRHW